MRATLGFALCLGVIATTAAAQDFPARKPGLWTLTSTTDGAANQMGDMQMCMDNSTGQRMASMNGGPPGMQQRCSKQEHHMAGNQMISDSICAVGNSTSTTHTVITFPNDTSWHMDGTTSYAPPLSGKASSKMTQDAKWMGPCPSGMVAGDIQTSNGMKFNMNNPSGTMQGLPPGMQGRPGMPSGMQGMPPGMPPKRP